MRCAARVLLGTERSEIPMMLLPPGVAPASVTRVSVDVADRPGILLRVLGVCQRRGARVLAMTYGPAGEHARIELAVSADERHVQLLHGRLAALIDVHGVAIRALSSGGAGAPARAAAREAAARRRPGRGR